MAKGPTYKGSPCKTAGCGGHRAGASYARTSGVKFSPYSRSFNKGMSIEAGISMPKPPKPRKK
jgi:hypothetical protein